MPARSFLGSGLPLDSALYCLGELDGEISLFKLDPATGKTAWSQRLVVPLGPIAAFSAAPARRRQSQLRVGTAGVSDVGGRRGGGRSVVANVAVGISLPHQRRGGSSRSADAVGRRAALHGNRRNVPLARFGPDHRRRKRAPDAARFRRAALPQPGRRHAAVEERARQPAVRRGRVWTAWSSSWAVRASRHCG